MATNSLAFSQQVRSLIFPQIIQGVRPNETLQVTAAHHAL
jgi:hypothetical protein